MVMVQNIIDNSININSVDSADASYKRIVRNYDDNVANKNASDYESSNVSLEDSNLLKSLEKFIADTEMIKTNISSIYSKWPEQYKNTKDDLNQMFEMISKCVLSFNEYKTLIEEKSKEVFTELNEKFSELNSDYVTKKSNIKADIDSAKAHDANYNNYHDNANLKRNEGDMYSANQYDAEASNELTQRNSLVDQLKVSIPQLASDVSQMVDTLNKGLKKG